MTPRRQIRRRRHMWLSPEGRRDVGHYDAGQLHTFLVEDAVKLHPTDLSWAVSAYERIGELTGRGADDAIRAVLLEAQALTGREGLPLG